MKMTKAAAAFDLSGLDTIEACNKPVEIEIKHPVSGVGTGVFVSIVGKDGDAYRSRVRGMADDSLRRSAMGKNASDTSIDKLEQKNIDALVAATTGWRTQAPALIGEKPESDPAVMMKGERLEFNAANARKVYSEILPIREQVSEAINDLGNFMPA